MLNYEETLTDMWDRMTADGLYRTWSDAYTLFWTREECLALAEPCKELVRAIARLGYGDAPQGELREVWQELLSSTVKEDMYLSFRRDLFAEHGEGWREKCTDEQRRELAARERALPIGSRYLNAPVDGKLTLIRRAKHLYKMVKKNAPEAIVRADARLVVEAYALYRYGKLR